MTNDTKGLEMRAQFEAWMASHCSDKDWALLMQRNEDGTYASRLASSLAEAFDAGLASQPAQPAAPEQRAVPEDVRRDSLRGPLAALIKAGDYLQPRILETNGANCMDQFEFALEAARAAMAAQPQGEGVSR